MTLVEIGIRTRFMDLIGRKWDTEKQIKGDFYIFCLISGVPGSGNK